MILKCLNPHYIGYFNLSGKELRKKGHNRIGNLIVPNNNYIKFEEWFTHILEEIYYKQVNNNKIWSPSQLINLMGKKIKNRSKNYKDIIFYWCYKNNIPVFCPAITDGSIGDLLWFHTFKTSKKIDKNI